MNYIITEEQYNDLIEMAYPSSFNMDEFKKLKSFNARYKYCKERLQYIASGSARYVFGIDNDKVLKLAKNQKGIAQNEREYDMANDYYMRMVAEVYDHDEKFLWIEMERVDKLTPNKFKQLTGIKFIDFSRGVNYVYIHDINGRYYSKPDVMDELWENEFFSDVASMLADYSMPSGDIGKISSWGVTKNGDLKLIDAGLSEEIFNDYYVTKQKKYY